MTGSIIVIGYTPSAEGAAALTTGIEEAQRRDAHVHVINASSGDAYIDARLAGSEQIDHVRGALEDSGVEHTLEQRVGRGEPADEILDAATRLSAALVVIGLRRRTAVGKLLLGSTAQQVLLRADCPVLAVKA